MTKLLARRWYISLPVLLACGMGVLVAAVAIEPDYAARGHVSLIPPKGTTDIEGRQNPIRNPWYDLGYAALGNAAIIDVTSKQVIEDLVADGLTDNVTVEMPSVTVFYVEAVGDSPRQATGTVQRMMALLEDAVAERQAQFDVADTELIGTLALDDGSNVEVNSSKTTRVLAVAVGVALLVTVASTVGFDALLRRRVARRDDVSEVAGSHYPGSVWPAVGHISAHPPSPAYPPTGGSPSPDEGSGSGGTRGSDSSGIPPQSPPVGADATIVLPLPKSSFARRTRNRKR